MASKRKTKSIPFIFIIIFLSLFHSGFCGGTPTSNPSFNHDLNIVGNASAQTRGTIHDKYLCYYLMVSIRLIESKNDILSSEKYNQLEILRSMLKEFFSDGNEEKSVVVALSKAEEKLVPGLVSEAVKKEPNFPNYNEIFRGSNSVSGATNMPSVSRPGSGTNGTAMPSDDGGSWTKGEATPVAEGGSWTRGAGSSATH